MKGMVSKKRDWQVQLKPCPFCGSTRIEKGTLEGIEGPVTWISCTLCGASTGLKGKAIDAIASWNLRIDRAE
jgi:Lar family restriction alleviation protein